MKYLSILHSQNRWHDIYAIMIDNRSTSVTYEEASPMKRYVSLFVLCCLTLAGIISGAEAGANNTSAAAANAIENKTIAYVFLQEGPAAVL